jgi:Asp-tRNA(Asn)/Glu-tRNA(Gln) amidotransferase A subunit family amidase
MEGVLPFAKSLDTLGFFTHRPDDMLGLWDALGYPIGQPDEVPLAVADPLPDVEPQMAEAFRQTIATLRRGGASIKPIDIAGMLTTLVADARTVMFYEEARFHEDRYKQYGERLQDMAALVREGLEIPVGKYDQARRSIAEGKARVAEIYKATPIILVPAAPGPAPRGLDSTGDSRMNAPWTALGTPAISIPMPVAGGLPLGLQLTGGQGADARVIRTAVRLHHILHDAR